MIDSLLTAVSDHARTAGGGTGMLVALVLLLLARWALPTDDRKLARLPLLLLILCVVVWVAGIPLDQDGGTARLLRLSGLFLLLASIGRSAFLIVVHAVIAKRLAFPLPRIMQDIIQIGVYVGIALIVLRQAGVEPGSILATSALLTAVIGLSLQDTLGNMFAGLAIQAERPFEVGDWIQYDEKPEHVGQVVEINWRATRINTLDRFVITVPNGVLAKSSISNFSQPKALTRRSTYVVAPYENSPAEVKRVLLEAVRDTPGVLSQPPPSILTWKFSERGIEYWVRFFIDDFPRREDIGGRVNDRLWYALSRIDVDIPVPRRRIEIEELTQERERQERESLVKRRLNALGQVDFLAPLPKELMAELATLAHTRLYAPSEHIIRQGEPGDDMYIVGRGKVAVLLKKKGKSRKVAELGAGKFFGEMSVMTGEPRSASIRAMEECEVIVVDQNAFHTILEKNASVLEEMSEILAARHNQLDAAGEDGGRAERPTEPGLLLRRIRRFFSYGPPKRDA